MPIRIPLGAAEKLIQEAQTKAINRLVEMLNTAIADDRFYLTADYILDESHNYTTKLR